MPPRLPVTLLPLLGLFLHARAALPFASDFVDPAIVLSDKLSYTTTNAQIATIGLARSLAEDGPWSVTKKSVTPPSGDKHDFLSWAPYWWPDCSKVGNTTALPQEEVWQKCTYSLRDGEVNPDTQLVNDGAAFDAMADAVFHNAVAWALTGLPDMAERAAQFVDAWFVAPDTRMKPSLEFAHLIRGPDGKASATGLLDLRAMPKLVSGVLILRQSGAPQWTADQDKALVAWAEEYIDQFLGHASTALEERKAKDYHGTFFHGQLAALQVLVGDNEGAKNTISEYFGGVFQEQISANGDQPLESARKQPFHYRAYNLAAMITNAKIGAYAGSPDFWTRAASSGATIQTALDYAIAQSAGDEHDAVAELYPSVLAVGAKFGDADGKYAKFLQESAGKEYVNLTPFLWDQPFSDSGIVAEGSELQMPHPERPKYLPNGKEESGARALGVRRGWVVAVFVAVGALLAV